MADYTLDSFSRTTLPVGQTLTFGVTDQGTAGTYPYTVSFVAARGSFSPVSGTITNPNDIVPGIVFTATSAGSDTISATNNAGNTNPAGQAITVTAAGSGAKANKLGLGISLGL
jgi:hypothetical protein